jgi:hypothetical protein
VSADVITEVYHNTFPLLTEHMSLLNRLQLFNVTSSTVELIYSRRYPMRQHEFVHPNPPNWFTKHFPGVKE